MSDEGSAFGDRRSTALLEEIARQPSVGDLARLTPETTALVRRLLAEGATVRDLTIATTALNDAIVRRVLALTEASLEADGKGKPPVRYCWLALGSEGRKEQTLRTDQDNAIVYDADTEVPHWGLERYFRWFAERAVEGIIRCGFPQCPAGIMASNERWRQPLDVWKEYFWSWIRRASPENLLSASIFFDFRAVWGDRELADRLAEHLRHEVANWRSFVRMMAGVAVSTGPPLGRFRRMVARLRGEKHGTVNLKLQGMLPLVNGARVHTLELGLSQTNTLERLRAADAHDGRFGEERLDNLQRAWDVIARMRLQQQVRDIDAGRSPTSQIAVGSLGHEERAFLREAFLTIRDFQGDLSTRFMTDVLYTGPIALR